MRRRKFGKTGLELSVLTFGGMQLPQVDQAEATRVVGRALEVGINHIETARWYGDSELKIGRALKELGISRKDVVLTTKIGPADKPGQMRRRIEESLQRLQVDHVENFDLHGINTPDLLKQFMNADNLGEARKAQEEGLIGHIGFSTHAPLEIILETINTGEFESVNLHYYYFNQHNRPAVDRAQELGMGVLIISPSDKGGKLYAPPEKLVDLSNPFHPVVVNHRFTMQHPAVTTLTLGATHPEEFDIHLPAGADDGPLTRDEAAAVARWDAQWETVRPALCEQCFKCLPCPEGIHIPEVLRLYNMARAFDMTDFGQYRYKMFENAGHWVPGNKANRCTECGDCLPRCPTKLPIPQMLFETHDLLFTGEGKRRWAEQEKKDKTGA